LLNGDRITEGSSNNQAFYHNPEVNQRLALAGGTFDRTLRIQRYREIESMVMRDAPWVPLYHERFPMVHNPRLHGDVPHPVWLWRYQNMWLEP